jgi:beta-xylosidase
MKKITISQIGRLILMSILMVTTLNLYAWSGMAMTELHVDGRYLKDGHGNIVHLHGFGQTYSPWFNEQGTKWTNYNVSACLSYNKGIIDGVMDAGWKINFVRMHMDPYWSNTPGISVTGENDISAFSMTRFEKYLDEVFVPMAEYIISKGMYVVMRPPGVGPEKIAVGDAYHKYLLQVWTYVAQHPKLKNNPNVMFELANEPIQILGSDGNYASSGKAAFEKLTEFFQGIVDAMRSQGCRNILWVPGLAYQSQYAGYATNPVQGENIGYAIHVYPGWYGSDAEQDSGEGIGTSTGGGYATFQKGWDNQIAPIADLAPIMVTEMDWAPSKYNSSWGKATTGTAGGSGFGANFKLIADNTGNVSWMIFTGPELLAQYKDISNPSTPYTFLTDPEACPYPVFQWFKEYAQTDYPRPDYTNLATSDNGDGTFSNPVIFADFPDPDVIRVGDTYYMVSTTMHIFPGATILKSKDLVNWEFAANPLERIESSDAYNLENGQNRYGQGQWATSLQYHDGKFYMLFCTNQEGGYLLTATNPEEDWTITKLKRGFYDCGLLFDNDDIYVVYGINTLHIAKLNENFEVVEDHEVATWSKKEGLEGSRLYKIGSYYYIYSTYGGWPAYQTVFRSKSIFGPYEEKFLLDDNCVHQGALVQTQTGEWWTMLFADRGAHGRLPYLLPVTWVDEWPVIGNNNKVMETCTKPNVGAEYGKTYLATNDVFRDYKLAPQWGWNHNSDKTKWSLTDRAGYLRLYTANVTDNPYQAHNTVTQRMFRFHSSPNESYATIGVDISGMKEGDVVGLGVFQDPQAFVGVKMIDGVKKYYFYSSSLTSKQDAQEVIGAEAKGYNSDVIYLRIIVSHDGTTSKAKFYASGINGYFPQIGPEVTLQYDLSVFTGNKFAIYNYATKALGGYVDVDWFSTEPIFSEDRFFDSSFTGYTEDSLTLDYLECASGDELTVMNGSETSLVINAVYKDGHKEDITTAATIRSSDNSVVEVNRGRLISKKDGNAVLTADYKGALGGSKNITISVNSTTFPLTAALFNPSIWETGSFDESTHQVITGQYGFAGWYYSNGVNLSDYKYLVAKLSKVCGGLSLRLYDQNNYWTTPVMYDVNTSNMNQVVVTLDKMYNSNSEKVDSSHLYYIGYWTYGGTPFVIDDMYLTNNDDYSKMASGLQDVVISDDDTIVDVFTIEGRKVRSNVSKKEATRGLSPGFYIVGNKKVYVHFYR